MSRLLTSRPFIALAGIICGFFVCFALFSFFYQGDSDGDIPEESYPLLQEAYGVLDDIDSGNYTRLASRISDKGLLITPFSTVELDRNVVFTKNEVKAFSETKTKYIFGVNPSTGSLLEMTPSEFMDTFLRRPDYSSAPVLGINTVVKRGNAVENVAEAFAESEFVDFFFPSSQANGIDWNSLKLVFEETNGKYRLVALVRSVYTDQ